MELKLTRHAVSYKIELHLAELEYVHSVVHFQELYSRAICLSQSNWYCNCNVRALI